MSIPPRQSWRDDHIIDVWTTSVTFDDAGYIQCASPAHRTASEIRMQADDGTDDTRGHTRPIYTDAVAII